LAALGSTEWGVGLMGAARVLAMLGLQVALPRGWRIR